MTKPLGFNNTYAIGMKEELAAQLNIHAISDLRGHPDLAIRFSNEFMQRGDGWPSLSRAYHLPHEDVRGLEHALAYEALDKGVIHVTDLYTTAARLAGAMKFVPDDRVVDGIDQTALLLLGEGRGRRNYMFHYSGGTLGAVRWDDFKVHILPGGGSLPPMEVYNVMRDPGEKFGKMYPNLFAVTPLQNLIKGHKLMIRKFPHRVSKTMPEGAEITSHD